ncbi:leucine-zipper-like transcriptional regulator 1 [Alligator mississippiensis]|uniref:Leucine-zipper-like transcriptional regulator 1 n=1 Tax=Alligator mississippiensis TaxID=8496 RepID=A0A151M149_ALLMI|nr:leucine-zipper-like transcriptional regulator 1 [Alligator mississippiensis]
MKGKTAECVWKPIPQSKSSPCDRYKHACCICKGFVYLHGGRHTTNLSDFWRYSIESNEWEMLHGSGDGPEELEEHSMVAYQGMLCVFGGMLDSAFTQTKAPLWMYDIDSARWTECRHTEAETESTAPANRKGHSAVVYSSSMYVYGGYFDIKGISQEFWALSFDTGEWSCISALSYDTGPGPRHGHSAVVYSTGMYLFGGLMGLSEQKDLWKWDFTSRNWSSIRTSQGPPKVVGHSSVVFRDSMLIFGGGISSSRPQSSLWKYHFSSQTWSKLAHTAKVAESHSLACAEATHCNCTLPALHRFSTHVSMQDVQTLSMGHLNISYTNKECTFLNDELQPPTSLCKLCGLLRLPRPKQESSGKCTRGSWEPTGRDQALTELSFAEQLS